MCPGTVDTDLINPNGMFEMMLGGADGRRAPTSSARSRSVACRRADEIAASICWLLSDDAAAVTGEAVNTSAGQTMV